MAIDEQLLKACKKNKRKAQKELYEICYPILLPMCMRYHKNVNDARAIYNEAYLKIINNLGKIDLKEVLFIPWARRIMTNTLIDEYRKNKKYNQKISHRDKERELEFHSENTRNKAETDFNAASILRLLDFLKPNTKRVFILYAIEGYPHKEIAKMLEMSEGTSKWHLSVARKELKILIEKQEQRTRVEIAI